jgi:hypothetical protein
MYFVNCSTEASYLNLYLTQLFSTLGHLTAAVVTSAVAVPMYNFYVLRAQKVSYNKYD